MEGNRVSLAEFAKFLPETPILAKKKIKKLSLKQKKRLLKEAQKEQNRKRKERNVAIYNNTRAYESLKRNNDYNFETDGKSSVGGEWGISHGEQKIINKLSAMKVNYVYDSEYPKLVNPKTGYNLRFDFFLPDYKCVIEYDGEQHFRYVKDFHKSKKSGALEDLQERDRFKDAFCEMNGIRMVRIKYTNFNKIKKIINTLMREFNTPITTTQNI